MRRRFRLAVTLAALATPLTACDEKKAESETLVLHGRVLTSGGSYLPGVTIVARCGSAEIRTAGSDMGDYAIELPRTGCQRAAITWEKESFTTVVRTLGLPSPRSEIVLNVGMAPLVELICGTECSPEDPTEVGGSAPAGEIARGWVGGYLGQEARRSIPGEFFDLDGQPVLLPALTVADYRNVSGASIVTLVSPFVLCSKTARTSHDEIEDIDPVVPAGTEGTIDFNVYDLDPKTGRWHVVDRGYVAAGGGDALGRFVAQAYPQDALGDVRRSQPPPISIAPGAGAGPDAVPTTLGDAWMCAPQRGSSVLGLGYTHPGKSCVVMEVLDECERPDANATVEIFGRDRTFFNWAPTDEDGKACLEAHRSEAIDEAQSANGVQGETFWVDVEVTTAAAVEKFEAVAMPTKDGNCGRPETCTVVRLARDPRVGQTSCEDAGVDPAATPGADAGTDPEGPIRVQGK